MRESWAGDANKLPPSLLIGLFYFHFNKMSPPLLFPAPHLLFCPRRFSQAVPPVDTPASSRLPANGAVNSVICVGARPDEGRARLNGAALCARWCRRDKSRRRKLKEEEMREMKGGHMKADGTKERKVEVPWMPRAELWQPGWDAVLISSRCRRHQNCNPKLFRGSHQRFDSNDILIVGFTGRGERVGTDAWFRNKSRKITENSVFKATRSGSHIP